MNKHNKSLSPVYSETEKNKPKSIEMNSKDQSKFNSNNNKIEYMNISDSIKDTKTTSQKLFTKSSNNYGKHEKGINSHSAVITNENTEEKSKLNVLFEKNNIIINKNKSKSKDFQHKEVTEKQKKTIEILNKYKSLRVYNVVINNHKSPNKTTSNNKYHGKSTLNEKRSDNNVNSTSSRLISNSNNNLNLNNFSKNNDKCSSNIDKYFKNNDKNKSFTKIVSKSSISNSKDKTSAIKTKNNRISTLFKGNTGEEYANTNKISKVLKNKKKLQNYVNNLNKNKNKGSVNMFSNNSYKSNYSNYTNFQNTNEMYNDSILSSYDLELKGEDINQLINKKPPSERKFDLINEIIEKFQELRTIMMEERNTSNYNSFDEILVNELSDKLIEITNAKCKDIIHEKDNCINFTIKNSFNNLNNIGIKAERSSLDFEDNSKYYLHSENNDKIDFKKSNSIKIENHEIEDEIGKKRKNLIKQNLTNVSLEDNFNCENNDKNEVCQFDDDKFTNNHSYDNENKSVNSENRNSCQERLDLDFNESRSNNKTNESQSNLSCIYCNITDITCNYCSKKQEFLSKINYFEEEDY